MSYQPSLSEWNWYVLMLGQAMIGAISPNIRMICLRFTSDTWKVEAVLEYENDEDKEEISDMADECAIFIDDVREHISDQAYKRITAEVAVSQSQLAIPKSDDIRVIFKRREPSYSV